MQVRKPTHWYAAVDYYRATFKGGRDAGLESQLIRSIQRIASEVHVGLCREESWSFVGYDGIRLGSCAYGYREPDGYILQGSGLSAQPLFDVGFPVENVPRLDIQVTLWYGEERPNLVKTTSIAASYARNGARGGRWKVRFIDGMGDGDTTYIGTRGKEAKFLRVYDKYAESGRDDAYKYAYRFEAELTDTHARNAAMSLRDLGANADVCASLVKGYFAERGITLPDLGGVVCVRPEQIPKDEGSEERRLRWLREQVSPAIDKLIANGVKLSLISEALGFTQYEQWERRQWL